MQYIFLIVLSFIKLVSKHFTANIIGQSILNTQILNDLKNRFNQNINNKIFTVLSKFSNLSENSHYLEMFYAINNIKKFYFFFFWSKIPIDIGDDIFFEWFNNLLKKEENIDKIIDNERSFLEKIETKQQSLITYLIFTETNNYMNTIKENKEQIKEIKIKISIINDTFYIIDIISVIFLYNYYIINEEKDKVINTELKKFNASIQKELININNCFIELKKELSKISINEIDLILKNNNNENLKKINTSFTSLQNLLAEFLKEKNKSIYEQLEEKITKSFDNNQDIKDKIIEFMKNSSINLIEQSIEYYHLLFLEKNNNSTNSLDENKNKIKEKDIKENKEKDIKEKIDKITKPFTNSCCLKIFYDIDKKILENSDQQDEQINILENSDHQDSYVSDEDSQDEEVNVKIEIKKNINQDPNIKIFKEQYWKSNIFFITIIIFLCLFPIILIFLKLIESRNLNEKNTIKNINYNKNHIDKDEIETLDNGDNDDNPIENTKDNDVYENTP